MGDYTVTLGGLDASTIKTATGSFSVAPIDTGNVSIEDTYTLAAVIDSGLTDSATGSITKAIAEDPTQSKFAKEIKIQVKTLAATLLLFQGLFSPYSHRTPELLK